MLYLQISLLCRRGVNFPSNYAKCFGDELEDIMHVFFFTVLRLRKCGRYLPLELV